MATSQDFSTLKKEFLLDCLAFNIIQFGDFTLKSGIKSPFYIDLRPLATNAEMLDRLSGLLLELTKGQDYELICGVPYAALPIATAMSLKSSKNLLIKRKETKKYGTKKNIEGLFEAGQKCLVVEDVITSGKSLLETLPDLENEGLNIEHIVVVLDRMQNGTENLEKRNYKVSALFNLREMMEILKQENKITHEQFNSVTHFIEEQNNPREIKLKRQKIDEKITQNSHPVAQKLVELALKKQSNLILSADFTQFSDIEEVVRHCGKSIVALKIHADIIADFEVETHAKKLKELASEYGFLIMEDRKFADIGNTQKLQFSEGTHQISSWADMVTAHPIGGKKSMEALEGTAVIAILSMSSEGALTSLQYAQAAEEVALSCDNCIGGVSQQKINDKLLCFTPGVNMSSTGDASGQQYNSPEIVFRDMNTDFIIVGRGIITAPNPSEEAEKYRTKAWEAYQTAIS